MVIDQNEHFKNEHILSQQYLRCKNICDLSWEKEILYYNTSFACVNSLQKIGKESKNARKQKKVYDLKLFEFKEPFMINCFFLIKLTQWKKNYQWVIFFTQLGNLKS